LRVLGDIDWLRRLDMYRAIRSALATVLGNHHRFRIVHFSLQSNHVHLLCEAEDKTALSRGVQGFQISAAKKINALLSKKRGTRRRGQVFTDRYHVESISSVRQTRHVLSYVLNNWRRHRQDGGAVGLCGGRIDPFSSGVVFAGWRDVQPPITLPANYELPLVSRPETWLLAESWKRSQPIGCFEVPGPRARVHDD
jgi:REP element-mobilizing transposase RayT